jgi:hypothetical protein
LIRDGMADVVAVRVFTGPCPAGVAPQGHGNAGHDPETVRQKRDRGTGDSPKLRRVREPAAASPPPSRNRAAPVSDYLDAFVSLERHEFAALDASLGVICFGVATAIALLRTAPATARELAACSPRSTSCARSATAPIALLLAEPQVIVVWPAGADEPDITGDVSILLRTPLPRRVLAFGTWLAPNRRLRWRTRSTRCAPKARAFRSRSPRCSSATCGRGPRDRRPRGAAHQDLTGARASSPSSPPVIEQLRRDVDTVAQLARGAARAGVGARRPGRLTWVNAAYARAVEARDGADAVARNLEILDSAARDGAPTRMRAAHPTRRACRSSSPARGASCR